MFFVRSQFNKENQAYRARNRWLSVLLCLMFVFAQGVGLAHTHEGELQKEFDCDICLNVSSSEDTIESSSQSFNLNTNTTSFMDYAERTPFGSAIPANSRAPPLV